MRPATSRSATAARPLQFPEHTRVRPRPARAWARASSSATSPSPRTSSWCAATRSATCTRPPTSSPSRSWPPSARSPSCRPIRPPARRRSAKCCTSDITLAEFKSLCGKMDALQSERDDARGILSAARRPSAPTCTRPAARVAHATTRASSWSTSLGREVHARAQEPRASRCRSTALHARAVRAEDDRRVQGARHLARSACSRSRSTSTTSSTGSSTSRRSASRPSTSTSASTRAGRLRRGRREHAGRARQQGVRIIAPPTCALRDARTHEPHRAVGLRRAAKSAGPRHHHLDARALGPARDDGGDYYYQSITPAINNDGDTYNAARRAGPPGRHPRHLLRLARHRDLLRQLHGPWPLAADFRALDAQRAGLARVERPSFCGVIPDSSRISESRRPGTAPPFSRNFASTSRAPDGPLATHVSHSRERARHASSHSRRSSRTADRMTCSTCSAGNRACCLDQG